MMKRLLVLLAVLALVAAACGGGDDEADTTQPASGTTQPAPTTTQAAPTTTQPAPTTTVASTTSAAPAAGSTADLAITEVVFGDHVTITNLGSAPVNVDGLWVCNRPAYAPLASATLAPGESVEVAAGSLSGLADNGGEVALYSSNSFNDASAILDYVGWGSGGGRATEAADNGVWPDGETVSVSGASISAPNGGSSAADWS